MPITILPNPTQVVSGAIGVTNLPSSPLLGESPDTPEAVYLVGNPAGDFDGLNPFELALDPSTGVSLQTSVVGPVAVTVTNPTPATVIPPSPATVLAPNAAAETGGNLNVLAEMLGLILVELRWHSLVMQSAFNVGDDPNTFRNDPTVLQ